MTEQQARAAFVATIRARVNQQPIAYLVELLIEPFRVAFGPLFNLFPPHPTAQIPPGMIAPPEWMMKGGASIGQGSRMEVKRHE